MDALGSSRWQVGRGNSVAICTSAAISLRPAVAMISRIAMRRSKCTASLTIRVTVLNDGPLKGVDAREILGRVRSLPPLPDVQGDGAWLKGCPRTRERAQIPDVLGARIPSAKYELDLPVYLRPQRTDGLTGGTCWPPFQGKFSCIYRGLQLLALQQWARSCLSRRLNPKEFSGAALSVRFLWIAHFCLQARRTAALRSKRPP